MYTLLSFRSLESRLLRLALVVVMMTLVPRLGGGGLEGEALASPLWRGARVLMKTMSRHRSALSGSRIRSLSRLAGRRQGTRLVGQAISRMGLPREVVVDSYLRIAVEQGKLSPRQAMRWFRSLRGTPGVRGALSKVIGQSAVKTQGHLNELAIAAQSQRRGVRVLAIGERFKDPMKRAETDIDLLLKVGGRRLAVEAKDYRALGRLPLDMVRRDLDTLKTYCRSGRSCVPVFSVTRRPSDVDYRRLLSESERRGVQVVVGDAASQAEQLKLLMEVL